MEPRAAAAHSRIPRIQPASRDIHPRLSHTGRNTEAGHTIDWPSIVDRNKLAIPYRQTIGRARLGHFTGLALDHQSQPKYPERMFLLTLQM
jgi:hypothetical protein